MDIVQEHVMHEAVEELLLEVQAASTKVWEYRKRNLKREAFAQEWASQGEANEKL